MTFEDLPLARSTIDRAALRRTDPALLASALTDPATRVVLVRQGAVLTTATTTTDPDVSVWTEVDDETHLVVTDPQDAVRLVDPADDAWLYLGQDSSAWFALRVPADREVPGSWTSLGAVGAILSARDAGLATTAVALDSWHARHPRCPQCGTQTRSASGGWVRVCPQDGSEHYPRTDPAVIMAVVDEQDRILLGRALSWPERQYSTLAGFVEAGESAEQAVRREAAEETGVVVDTVDYVTSQPWPFPGSLMLAYRARAWWSEPQPEPAELADARWFTREELAEAVSERRVRLPGRASVARALIEDWHGGPLANG